MKRLVIPAALVASACVHTDLERNSPGRTDVATPPRAPAAHAVERPRDPGQRAIVVTASAMVGGGSTGYEGSMHGLADAGLELSVTHNTLEQSFWGGIMGPRDPWRANLGWMFYRSANDHERTGPSYAEVQYSAFNELAGASLALGAAWEWQKPAAGPQATLCAGPIPVMAVCVRGTHMFGEGSEIGVRFVVLTGLAEWVWSR